MEKRICQLLVVFAMVFWPAICQALPDEKGEYTKLGVGNFSCNQWTQARQNGAAQEVLWRTVIIGWVQGFLTAYNLYGPGTLTITKGTDAESVAGWFDNYCVQHPLNNIASATEALVAELYKRRAAL